jgi:23S rRNA (uracil1939-C5)-methyltransferase
MRAKTEAHLAAGGDAIARAPDGRIVFVEGAAPDEEVRIEITKDNPRFLRGRAVEILEPSPHRVEPRCRHFGECGGCVLQHVDHAAQVASKQAALLETLRRIGRLDLARVRIDQPWMGEPYRYRTRVRFFVKGGKAGFKRARSNEVFDATECPILVPELEDLLVHHDRSEPGEIAVPSLFAQANDAGNRAMQDHLAALLHESGPFSSALEVYGGSGNFTGIIARHAAAVTMVESNRDATRLARRALPDVRVLDLPAEEAPDDRVDLVVIDPPRAGMSEAALSRIARAAGRILLYVSCDPATFARDAARLADRALALDSIRLFDLYPQTAHSEVVGRFRRTT